MRKMLGMLVMIGLMSAIVGCGSDGDHDMDGMNMDDMEHHQMDEKHQDHD